MKVSIIGGGGRVGSDAAYALQFGGIVREIALVDNNPAGGSPPAFSGSGFPSGDAPSPCGIPDDDDRGRLHMPVHSAEGNGSGYGDEKGFQHSTSCSLQSLGCWQPRLSRLIDEYPCSSRNSGASMTRWRGSYTRKSRSSDHAMLTTGTTVRWRVVQHAIKWTLLSIQKHDAVSLASSEHFRGVLIAR